MSQEPTCMPDSAADGVYLFCFACPAVLPAIGGPGLEDTRAVSCEVAGGIVAVVAPVNVEEYSGPASEANLRDLAWMAPRAFHHETVIERVMRGSPVLPARFGTIFASPESVARFLERHHLAITRFLESITGKEEWAVKGFLERSRAEKRLLEADDRFLRLPSSPGIRYMQLQRLRADVGRAVASWAGTAVQAIGKELESEAVDVRAMKPRALDVPEKMFEEIANWAFLLCRDTVEHFRERVEHVGARYREEGVHLEVSGPWPPYNFCPSLGDDEESAHSPAEMSD